MKGLRNLASRDMRTTYGLLTDRDEWLVGFKRECKPAASISQRSTLALIGVARVAMNWEMKSTLRGFSLDTTDPVESITYRRYELLDPQIPLVRAYDC